jgi:hypothetical protein
LRYSDGRGIASRFGGIHSGYLTDFAGGDAFTFSALLDDSFYHSHHPNT